MCESIYVGVDRRFVRLEFGDLVGPLLCLRLHQVATGHHLYIVNPGLRQFL